ncbi:MAG: carbohydrate-binding family 9-like protein [Chitinivibrionales bacterium]|nr:carbohydrate-binding family 9-like protein [Chitinivibrionales bacterium]
MKQIFIMTLLFLSVGVVSKLFSQTLKYQIAPHATTANITIDGKLDEPAWNAATTTDRFVNFKDGKPLPLETTAKIVVDNTNLYMGFYVQDTDIYAKATQQDDEFYERDDLVELFIDFDGNGIDYLEVGISARGTYYDYIIINPDNDNWQDDKTWDAKSLEVKTQIIGTLNTSGDKDSCWSCEVKIPLASMNFDKSGIKLPLTIGSTWRFDLFRKDFDHQTPEGKPNGEYAWSWTGDNGFHTPDRFGTLQFQQSTKVIADKIPKPMYVLPIVVYDHYRNLLSISSPNGTNVAPGSITLFTCTGRQFFHEDLGDVQLPVYLNMTRYGMPGVILYTLKPIDNKESAISGKILLK